MTAEPLHHGPAPDADRLDPARPGRGLPTFQDVERFKKHQPAGALPLPKVRPLSSTSTRPRSEQRPKNEGNATLTLAALVIDDVLRASAGRVPDREVLPDLVEGMISTEAARAYGLSLTRHGLRSAGSAAQDYLNFLTPRDLAFAGPAVTVAVAQLPADFRAGRVQPPGRRLAWARDDGRGLLLDRLTLSYRTDCVRNPWIEPQLRADLRLGRELSGDSFAGVRIWAIRSIFIGLHVLPDGSDHSFGKCATCKLGKALA